MKKRIAVVSIVMVLLLLGVLTFLSIPKHVSENYMVCSTEGEVKKVELNITIHRGMFKNKGITGKIIFDGTEYISVEDAYKNGPSGRGQFVIPTLNAFDITESIYIEEIETGKNMKYIWLHEVGEKGHYSYFGPAKSIEEMNEITRMILEAWE